MDKMGLVVDISRDTVFTLSQIYWCNRSRPPAYFYLKVMCGGSQSRKPSMLRPVPNKVNIWFSGKRSFQCLIKPEFIVISAILEFNLVDLF